MAKRKSPTNRTVKARGAFLRRLRIQNALTVEELAEKAGVSAKTISNAENRIGVSPNKLAQHAEALGENYEDVLEVPAVPLKPRKIRLTFELELGDNDPNTVIAELLKTVSALHKTSVPLVSVGSIIITLWMYPDDIERVCEQYDDGRLHSLELYDLFIPRRFPDPLSQRHIRIISTPNKVTLDTYIIEAAKHDHRITDVGVRPPDRKYTIAVPFSSKRFKKLDEARISAIRSLVKHWFALGIDEEFNDDETYFENLIDSKEESETRL